MLHAGSESLNDLYVPGGGTVFLKVFRCWQGGNSVLMLTPKVLYALGNRVFAEQSLYFHLVKACSDLRL